MPRPLASLGSLVHPHQIEIQEFASYALVIDARSAEAYQEDHVPGAISLPVGAASWVDRRSGLAMAAQGVGVSEAAPSLPYGLAARVQHLSPGASVLVYCDRGGLDSLQWAAPLRAAGFRVDVLGGGWGNCEASSMTWRGGRHGHRDAPLQTDARAHVADGRPLR